MSVTGLVLLVLFGSAGVAWWRLLKGKELARASAAAMCIRPESLLTTAVASESRSTASASRVRPARSRQRG